MNKKFLLPLFLLPLLCSINAQATLSVNYENKIILIKTVTDDGKVETLGGEEYYAKSNQILEIIKKHKDEQVNIIYFNMGEKKTITNINQEQ